METILIAIGTGLGLALLLAGVGLGSWRWRTERRLTALRAELGEETPKVAFAAIVGDGQRAGSGAVALLEDRLEVRTNAFAPRTIRLREIRALSPRLAMRRLVRYEAAAPTFSLLLRNRDTIDIVVYSNDREALDTFRTGLDPSA